MKRRSALAAMLATLAGCGGGGGGELAATSVVGGASTPDPIPTPTLVSTPTPAPAVTQEPAPAATPSPPAPNFNYFVDSVTGSDANNGLSPATAFATIGRLNSILGGNYTNQKIGLARGSYWREQIGSISNTSADVVIDAYGTGVLPVIDAADTVKSGSWSKTAGFANAYDLVWNHTASAGSSISVWEDGARLRWVASIADCDLMPGTFYAAKITGGSTPVYINPTGGGDPNRNGKAYEICSRDFAICAGSSGRSWQVSNVRTKRQAANDGSLVLAAPGSVARSCVAEDGTKHNLFIGADCEAHYCIAWKSDWADRTNSTLFVAYANDGTGKSAKFVNCAAIGIAAHAVEAMRTANAIDGFYAHTTGSTRRWAAVEYLDCVAIGCCSGMAASDVEVLTITRPRIDDSNFGLRSGAVTGKVIDAYITQGRTVPYGSAYDHAAGDVEIDGLREFSSSGSSRGSVCSTRPGKVHVHHSVLVRGPAATGYRVMVNGNSAGTDVRLFNSIIHTPTGAASMGYRAVDAGQADFNVYFPASIDMVVGSSSYADFASYTSGQPSFDQSSAAADPLLNDPAGGDFGHSPESPAAALQAGLLRPHATYAPIPTDSAITAL